MIKRVYMYTVHSVIDCRIIFFLLVQYFSSSFPVKDWIRSVTPFYSSVWGCINVSILELHNCDNDPLYNDSQCLVLVCTQVITWIFSNDKIFMYVYFGIIINLIGPYFFEKKIKLKFADSVWLIAINCGHIKTITCIFSFTCNELQTVMCIFPFTSNVLQWLHLCLKHSI